MISREEIEEMSIDELKDLLSNLEEKDLKSIRFSIALGIVERVSELFEVERENIDIEDAIGLYEKGMDLLIACREKLAVVESKKEEIDRKYRALIASQQDKREQSDNHEED
ncbi:MAG TPA: hypothetical protein DCE14_02130 [Kosmotogaceae bacterium]|nr:MAG: Exonuclease VII small subunit [Thermotogales bacterium 46_20]HAA85130.1 hypothetical protein [Kosmotogaceae bacterium]